MDNQQTSKIIKRKKDSAQVRLQHISKLFEENAINKIRNNKQKNKLKSKTQKSKQIINDEIKKKSDFKTKFKKKTKLKKINNNSNLESANNKKLNNEKSKKKPKKVSPIESLREKMQNKLKAAQFRYLNEQLYVNKGEEAKKFFQSDPNSFQAYHDGFKQQVAKWPMNPLNKIIQHIRKMPKKHVIADFGCGEAKLAQSVPQKVFSFDFVAMVPDVIACDMANCNLENATVDVVVFCLSLMGTNIKDYLLEANRVLKLGGIMKIAEVESRFESVSTFVLKLKNFGFQLIQQDLSNNLFYFMDFKKIRDLNNTSKLPAITLKPCLYKKR